MNSIETNRSKFLLLNYTSVGANYNHGQKFLNTFAFLGRFAIHTGPTPALTPTMLDAYIQSFNFV